MSLPPYVTFSSLKFRGLIFRKPSRHIFPTVFLP